MLQKEKGDLELQFSLIKALGKAVNAHSERRVRPPQMEEVDLKRQRWTALSSGDERQVGSGGQVPAGCETQADSSVQLEGRLSEARETVDSGLTAKTRPSSNQTS